jgi:anaerobic ribonucleoside-triphosphate reductase activating protein
VEKRGEAVGQGGSLRLYAQIAMTSALGPFSRYALWVQGCPFCCPGCMTLAARSFEGGYEAGVAAVAEAVLAQRGLEGLTISGGEPFAQAWALAQLLELARARRDIGVIVYSGYTLEQLELKARAEPATAALLSRIDLLIDGPYMEQHNDGGALKGSSNQRAHFLTPRYSGFARLYQPDQSRRVELHVARDELMLVGIPSARQLDWWRNKRGGGA